MVTRTKPRTEPARPVRSAAPLQLPALPVERMSKVDTAWLRMDGPNNLMMIVGIWVLQPGVKFAAISQRLHERMLKYPRFRQCAVSDRVGFNWVEDHDFDIRRHVVQERLPRHRPGQHQAALQQRVAELAMQPLDRAHPLWQFHLMPDYPGPDGQPGSALVMRIHHCIADGIALISVVMSLVDGGEPPPHGRSRRAPHAAGLAGAGEWLADSLIKPLAGLTGRALDAAGSGALRSLQALGRPQRGLSAAREAGRLALHAAADAAALALMADDSKTRLKGRPGTAKRIAWCQPIPFDEVKAVSKALNCSINDVLLSCVAGAIGAYLRALGDDVSGQEIRAMVPVNLRSLDDAHQLGNHFGLAPVVLPIGLNNPLERVFEVRRRMTALKGSMQPLMAFGLLAVAGLLVKSLQDAMLRLFSQKTTAVMTNVPGPREKLRLCGATLEQSLFWVPQSGSVGLGVSILSYGGGVQFGVITDSTLCPEPQQIIDRFQPEFAKLGWLTLMLPWGD